MQCRSGELPLGIDNVMCLCPCFGHVDSNTCSFVNAKDLYREPEFGSNHRKIILHIFSFSEDFNAPESSAPKL